MDTRRSYFYRLQVERWHGQHERVLRDRHPLLYVEAAMHATLARLRCYSTRWELLRVNDMTQAGDLVCIHSLLDATEVADGLAWSVRAASLYQSWQALAGTSEGPCAPSRR